MRHTFTLLLLVAGLAGCAGSTPPPADTRNDKEAPLPSGQGAFGNAFTWEWRKKDAPPPPSAAPAATPAAPVQGSAQPPVGSDAERREFEEWRAWQEWKRKNAK